MKDDRVYLQHVRDALHRIREYTAPGRPTFFEDTKTQDAVLRNLEVVGEAVKQMSDQLKARHPHVAWRRIAGMRDKLIHDYFGVNLQLVWDVVEREIPGLSETIRAILESLEPPSRPG